MTVHNVQPTYTDQKVKQSLQQLRLCSEEGSQQVIDLIRSLGEEGIQTLTACLEDGDGDTRRSAVWALLLLDAEKFLPLTLPFLNDPVPSVRWFVVWKIGELGDERSVEPLCQVALHDFLMDVRFMACISLGQLGRENMIPVLETISEQDDGITLEGETMKWIAQWAVQKVRIRSGLQGRADEGSIRQKVKRLLWELRLCPEECKKQIVERIRGWGESGLTELAACLGDSDENIRCDAAWALLLLDAGEYLPLTLPLLTDPLPSVRWGVAGLYREFGDERCMDALCQVALKDPDADVRIAACDALGELGGEHVIQVLECIMENDNGTDYEGNPVRWIVQRIIQQMRARTDSRVETRE